MSPRQPQSTGPFKTAVIDDVQARNLDQHMQSHLLGLFKHTMKAIASTLVREVKFDTSDFATAKERSCEGFALLVSRAHVDSRNEWFGAFQRGEQRLDVIGHLE